MPYPIGLMKKTGKKALKNPKYDLSKTVIKFSRKLKTATQTLAKLLIISHSKKSNTKEHTSER